MSIALSNIVCLYLNRNIYCTATEDGKRYDSVVLVMGLLLHPYVSRLSNSGNSNNKLHLF